MKYNSEGLSYPRNIYRDVELFRQENEERCYYYHKVSTEVPQNPAETMDYLLDTFFAPREKLINLIARLYKEGKPFADAAQAAGLTGSECEEILKKFFRDLLYFPRYNDIFSQGVR